MKNMDVVIGAIIACVSYQIGKRKGLDIAKEYLMQTIINNMDDEKEDKDN